MKIKLPDCFVKDDKVLLISIFNNKLILVNKSDYNPKPILLNDKLDKEYRRNIYRFINANTYEFKVVNNIVDIPCYFEEFTLQVNDKSIYIINNEKIYESKKLYLSSK